MTATQTVQLPRPMPTPVHEHAWTVESRHPTSEGSVLYVRCDCGSRRVDVQRDLLAPPAAISRALRGWL